MDTILKWIKEYSAGSLTVILLAGALLYVTKLIVDKSVSDAVALQTKTLELAISRRSSFEDRVLTDRYNRIVDLAARLGRVMTNINRFRSGKNIPDGFVKAGEIVSLTEIYEDLQTHRLVLTEPFHHLLSEKADLAREFARADDAKPLIDRWLALDERLRAAIDQEFGISKITWQSVPGHQSRSATVASR